MRRRRLLLVTLYLLAPRPAGAVIVEPPPASRGVRHAVPWPQLLALNGQRLQDAKAKAPALTRAIKRLLGRRYDEFIGGLTDEAPMQRIGDVLFGQGVRPNTLGYKASLFILGRRGELFVAIKSGKYGGRIEQFGDKSVLADWDVKHSYLEFADLHE